MRRSYAPRHKYPNKRRRTRLFLFSGGVALFLLILLGVVLFYGDSGDGDSTILAQAMKTLSPEEEYPQGALPAKMLFDKLLLEKNSRKLTAFSGGKPVRVYLVSLGKEPVGHKAFEGDMRTPEGSYTIDAKSPASAYYKNVGISYPNAEDRKNALKLGKSPGGDIKIHGLAPHFSALGALHRLTDWTYGCVAVTNPEMEEIYNRTLVGTPIEIVP